MAATKEKDETEEKDESKSKSKDSEKSKGSKDSGKSKSSKDSEKSEESKGQSEDDGDETAGGISLANKAFRAFLFAALATFLTGLLFANSLPNGLRVDFDLVASIKLGLISGVIAAVLRGVVGVLPVFPDD